MRRASSLAVTATLAVTLSACSLSVGKPPPAYRAGVVPDCGSSYVPPAIDTVGLAGSIGSMALDDGYFCPTCPLPYIGAAVFAAAAVWGSLRVHKCRGLKDQHAEFLALPREQQDQRIRERRAAE